MAMPALFDGRLSIPAIGAPLFIISGPELVIAQCKTGVVGAFNALNARPQAMLDDWLTHIATELAAHAEANPQHPPAPYAVNLIVNKSNDRLQQDLATCERHRVPVVITSLGAVEEVNQAVHGWGGIVLHDVINQRFARKAIGQGADGLILVAAGAGGHAGTQSPFALVAETRQWFDGPVALSGAIATGRAIRAAQVMGADLAYIGSPFIATHEANADPAHKRMIADCAAADITYTNLISGIHGNYLRPSIAAAGLDPDALPIAEGKTWQGGQRPKAWKDVWGSGHGIGSVTDVVPVAELVARLRTEYAQACA